MRIFKIVINKLKVKIGILGTASIAMEQVIPAMMNGDYGDVCAIASRSLEKARSAAAIFNLKNYYGSYQELLENKEIVAVYIPLPNHLHVQWAIKALRAGKHVLVEKPVAMNVEEAKSLLEVSRQYPRLKLMEAFMYKFHPQWITTGELIENGAIGALKVIQSSFSFFEDDEKNIVNCKEYGGGSLMDIGCYPISVSRLLFGTEPINISSNLTYHNKLKIDVFASGILEFDHGYSMFFSAINMTENQKVEIFGTIGKIVIDWPFNPPIDRPTSISVSNKDGVKNVIFDICNQFTLQADAFCKAIIDDDDVVTDIEDAVKNMIVIEKMFSA